MSKTFIIAEIGINHNGDVETAKELIHVASAAKVDAVKFQAWSKDRFPEIEHLRLSKDQLWYLYSYTLSLGIGLKWMCTAFDSGSIAFLYRLGSKRWKVPSGMVTNHPYLEEIRLSEPDHIILSTGMADLDEIGKALEILTGTIICPRDITILHCCTCYPTGIDDVNLKAMLTIKEIFRAPVGLSDHSGLIEIPIAAVAMGASIIEVHITLDRNQKGPDHKASYEPDDLISMVNMIRHIELAMGDGIKRPVPREMETREAIRDKMKGGII